MKQTLLFADPLGTTLKALNRRRYPSHSKSNVSIVSCTLDTMLSSIVVLGLAASALLSVTAVAVRKADDNMTTVSLDHAIAIVPVGPNTITTATLDHMVAVWPSTKLIP